MSTRRRRSSPSLQRKADRKLKPLPPPPWKGRGTPQAGADPARTTPRR